MKYVLNHTETVLSIGKYNEIAPGKYGTITDAEVEAPEVIYAVRAKWASIHAEIPKEFDFVKPEMQFEGQAYQEQAPAPEPEVVAEVAEEVAEIADPAQVEEVVEETAEAKPAARGRKTK